MLELYSGALCAFRTNAKVGARGKYSYEVNSWLHKTHTKVTQFSYCMYIGPLININTKLMVTGYTRPILQ